jgi:hypothetical protein
MDPIAENLLHFAMLVAMLIGLFGLVIPFFPGITVIWVFTLLHGLIFGFGRLGLVLFVAISLLTILGWVADNFLMGATARKSGARWTSIAVALLAAFVASLLLTPLGGIVAALLAIFLMEYAYRKDAQEALETMKQMFYGFGWAFVARFAIGIVMIVLWAIWAWAF